MLTVEYKKSNTTWEPCIDVGGKMLTLSSAIKMQISKLLPVRYEPTDDHYTASIRDPTVDPTVDEVVKWIIETCQKYLVFKEDK